MRIQVFERSMWANNVGLIFFERWKFSCALKAENRSETDVSGETFGKQ